MEFMLGGSRKKGVVLAAGTAEQASSKKGGLKISLEQREQDGWPQGPEVSKPGVQRSLQVVPY